MPTVGVAAYFCFANRNVPRGTFVRGSPPPRSPLRASGRPPERPAAAPRAPGGCSTRAADVPANRSARRPAGATGGGQGLLPGSRAAPRDTAWIGGGPMRPRRLPTAGRLPERWAWDRYGCSVGAPQHQGPMTGSSQLLLDLPQGPSPGRASVRAIGGAAGPRVGPVVGPEPTRRSPASLSRLCVVAAPRAPAGRAARAGRPAAERRFLFVGPVARPRGPLAPDTGLPPPGGLRACVRAPPGLRPPARAPGERAEEPGLWPASGPLGPASARSRRAEAPGAW